MQHTATEFSEDRGLAKATKKGLGRPPLPPAERRGHTMGFKPTPEIRRRLQEAAKANERSVSKEIEMRLERSFADEEARYDEFGGRGGYEIFRVVGTAASALGRTLAKTDWWRDPRIFKEVSRELCPSLLGVFQKEIGENERVRSGTALYWHLRLELAEPTDDGGKGKYRTVFRRISSFKL